MSVVPIRWVFDRRVAGGLVAVLTLALAVVAALLTASGAGRVAGGVEYLAFASAGWLAELARRLPLGYAFGAGMVASVNPCGFALLPAYLGFYLGAEEADREPRRRVLRAAALAAMVSAGFVLIFGAVGLVLSLTTAAIAGYFPLLGLVVGVLLVIAGGGTLSDTALHLTLGQGVAARVGARARNRTGWGALAYGVAYGAASLSCTLPIFLTVVGSTLVVEGILAGVLQFVLYALGMGSVLGALAVCAAFLGHTALARTRRLGRLVRPANGVLLLLAGSYLAYYWLTVGGVLAGVGLG